MNKKRKKYATGSYVTNYMENPAKEFQQNSIDIAEAKAEAATNPLAILTKILGNATMAKGVEMGGFGDSALGGIMNNVLPTLGNMKFAMGGDVEIEVEDGEVAETPDGLLFEFFGNTHAEGGIDVDVPSGTKIFSEKLKLDGETMAERKMKRERKEARVEKITNLRSGDEIMKNTLKKTKSNNEAQQAKDMDIMNMMKLLQDIQNTDMDVAETVGLATKKADVSEMGGDVYETGGDTDPWKFLKGLQSAWGKFVDAKGNPFASTDFTQFETTPDYQGDAFEIPEFNLPFVDVKAPAPREIIGENILDKSLNKDSEINLGGSFAKLSDAPSFDTKSDSIPDLMSIDNLEVAERNKGFKNLLDNLGKGDATFGDGLGLFGNLVSSFGPMINTLRNRASDTPNINAFENFGIEGLQKIAEAQGYIEGQKDESLKDLELARRGSTARNRKGARSVNTMRALDLATDQQINDAQGNIYNAFAQQMMQLMTTEAQMENQQDQMVMTGEQARDLADRQDKDNFATQLAQDISTLGTGLQETGKDINAIKERAVMMTLLNQMSKYGIGFDKNGNLITVDKDDN